MKTIVVNDGDDFMVMVRTKKPTAFDPANEYGSVLRAYRVTGIKSSESVLELTPIMSPILVSSADADRIEVEQELS